MDGEALVLLGRRRELCASYGPACGPGSGA
jgi:hypothetical protein